MWTRATALAWLCFSLVACSSLDLGHLLESDRAARVEEAVEAYANGLRWGRIELVSRLVRPDLRPDFLEFARREPPTVQFTGYEVQAIELGVDPDSAEALVSFELYRLPSVQQATIVERQLWEYHRDARRWYLVPDLALYRGDVSATER